MCIEKINTASSSGLKGEEIMTAVNYVRVAAALLAGACWLKSATIKLTRIKPGLEELDKATSLADDLQAMGRWNAAAALFACVAAFADAIAVF
jgi:hypothetical protein